MRNRLKKFFTARVWLTLLVCICFFFIGLTFFTDALTKPLQKITSAVIIPMQKGVNGIGLWLTEKSDLLVSVEKLQSENSDLRQEFDISLIHQLQITAYGTDVGCI